MQPDIKESDAETARRHRVLIAAAVAAVISGARIREIRPATWTWRRPAGERMTPHFPRLTVSPELEMELDLEEEAMS